MPVLLSCVCFDAAHLFLSVFRPVSLSLSRARARARAESRVPRYRSLGIVLFDRRFLVKRFRAPRVTSVMGVDGSRLSRHSAEKRIERRRRSSERFAGFFYARAVITSDKIGTRTSRVRVILFSSRDPIPVRELPPMSTKRRGYAYVRSKYFFFFLFRVYGR